MPDRNEDLRKEAARCLEAAARSTDPHARVELIRLSQVSLSLPKVPGKTLPPCWKHSPI
jgi:hypothetical protein